MNVVILSAGCPEDVWRRAMSRAFAGAREPPSRRHEGTLWTQLPSSARPSIAGDLARELGAPVTVVEVRIVLGGRGRGLGASRHRVLPDGSRSPAEDLTGEAREILHELRADAAGPGFDEDLAAEDVARALVETETPGAGAGEKPPADFEDRWAASLLDALLDDGSVELAKARRRAALEARIARQLERVDGGDLGERLLELLLEAPEVEEVFVEASELLQLATERRPGSP